MDDIFYELVWRPRWTGPLVETSPPAPARRVEVLPKTDWAETAEEVADEAESERVRLADLVAAGLSPLEAARLLFAEGTAS
ncbi:hypothetical protein FXF51_05875 [Nonomuraea sp. PA05]|uniref:hypothetical protein n=1 Tax=Nonomuraea sp. PA05 TaxID=2604466 RepID=UPI0011DA34CA|nr:hypothetical protein [Nonomuraea sp. PA05]TYB69688.1 hypothetical protein FXF51_05875 [Nonomuraea sp. PA05]